MKTRIIKQGNGYKPQYYSWWSWRDFDLCWYSSFVAAKEALDILTNTNEVVWESDK